MPHPSCLLVGKMHIYSVHYAILDFKREVYLTDLIFPPCGSLSGITITAWCISEKSEDAFLLVSSEDINKKALVMSNLVAPMKLRYMKVRIHHFSFTKSS